MKVFGCVTRVPKSTTTASIGADLLERNVDCGIVAAVAGIIVGHIVRVACGYGLEAFA